MNKQLKIPQVNAYVHRLGRVNYREVSTCYTYDEASYPLINEIYELIQQIAPTGQYGHRAFWIPVERGTLADFADSYGSYEEMREWGDVASEQEYENYWKTEFPEEVEWFYVVVTEDKDIDYRAIFINNKHVIEVDGRKKEKSYPNEISDFCQWLADGIKGVIQALRDRTYNARVARELPMHKRIGTISQSQLWELYPEEKADFFQNLTEQGKQIFLQYADSSTAERMPQMTANAFFRACALGYAANGYGLSDLTPKEQYDAKADGRDEGLMELDADSPQAFESWYHSKRGGGHPWEVVRGGNSTHISLYVRHDEDGWYFSVAGSAYGRTIETVQFFLALHKAGFPVAVHDAEKLKERLLGTELVGIVPDYVFPRYCHSYFEKDGCISFMHLPYEDTEAMAAKCTWYPIPEVKLN